MAPLPEEFVKWELGASAVDFKVEYVDIAGDLIAGLMLSQIVWSYLPSTKRPLVSKKGHDWLVKGESEWYDECRLSKKRVRRGLERLKKRRLIEVEKMPHYRRKNISHIRLNVERFCELWQKFADLSTSFNGSQKAPSNDSNKSNGAQRDLLDSTQRAPSNRDFRDLEKTLTFDEHVFTEVLQALTTINKQLESMKIKPLTNLPYLAQKIARRGDTVAEMRQAALNSRWQACLLVSLRNSANRLACVRSTCATRTSQTARPYRYDRRSQGPNFYDGRFLNNCHLSN